MAAHEFPRARDEADRRVVMLYPEHKSAARRVLALSSVLVNQGAAAATAQPAV
ncbi:hypothetical protein ACQEVY_05560 [Streptomyces sp. CA-288835]|uniref:hypothetical protein n=1 Tax=Streptomyces sp. CA-288835 TaxID=3240069 RepID=UPI003D8B6E49